MKPLFTEVVSNYINLVYHFARRWTHGRGEVDDIVHETFLKALRTYDTFKFNTNSELKSWLLTICRHIILNSYREKSTIQLEEHHDNHDNQVNESQIDTWLERLIHEEDLQAVHTQLRHMHFIDQEIVKLRIDQELSFKEISVVLDLSEAAIKMRFYRVIQKIQEVLL